MPHHYTTSDVLRFQSKIKVMPSGCHEWQGSVGKHGYGKLSINNKMVLAHRIAWEIEHGPIPDGMDCCHTCDNRRCVNPAHMFIGTRKDNMHDASLKGRLSRTHQPKGERHGNAKLTDESVRVIRRLAMDGASYKSIARIYGVSDTLIRMAVNRQTWKHVE